MTHAELRFDAQQLATLRALGEHRGTQQFLVALSPEVLSGLRQVAVVESTESSCRQEGGSTSDHPCSSTPIRKAVVSRKSLAIAVP